MNKTQTFSFDREICLKGMFWIESFIFGWFGQLLSNHNLSFANIEQI